MVEIETDRQDADRPVVAVQAEEIEVKRGHPKTYFIKQKTARLNGRFFNFDG